MDRESLEKLKDESKQKWIEFNFFKISTLQTAMDSNGGCLPKDSPIVLRAKELEKESLELSNRYNDELLKFLKENPEVKPVSVKINADGSVETENDPSDDLFKGVDSIDPTKLQKVHIDVNGNILDKDGNPIHDLNACVTMDSIFKSEQEIEDEKNGIKKEGEVAESKTNWWDTPTNEKIDLNLIPKNCMRESDFDWSDFDGSDLIGASTMELKNAGFNESELNKIKKLKDTLKANTPNLPEFGGDKTPEEKEKEKKEQEDLKFDLSMIASMLPKPSIPEPPVIPGPQMILNVIVLGLKKAALSAKESIMEKLKEQMASSMLKDIKKGKIDLNKKIGLEKAKLDGLIPSSQRELIDKWKQEAKEKAENEKTTLIRDSKGNLTKVVDKTKLSTLDNGLNKLAELEAKKLTLKKQLSKICS